MRKNKLIKILMLSILLSIMLLNNFSYATILTKGQIKKSLENVLFSTVKIESKDKDEDGTASTTITIGAPEEGENIIVEDSRIRCIIEEYNFEFNIDYSIEGGICIFKTGLDINGENIENVDTAMIKAMLGFMQYNILQECYIAVSDAMGLDNSLTYTYYAQQYKDADEVNNDVYNLTRKQTEDVIEYTLKIDMEQLSNIDSSKIDNTKSYLVTIIKNNSEKEDSNEEDKIVVTDKNIENNSQEKLNTKKDTNIDNTVAKTTIPKTGKTMQISIMIVILAGVTIINYKLYKNRK